MSHTNRRCGCVAEHRPEPLEPDIHHVLPRFLGGGDEPANLIPLCPTTHRNVHELLRWMLREGHLISQARFCSLYDEPVSRHAVKLARAGMALYLRSRSAA